MSGSRHLDDLDDDIRDHIERETEGNIQRGMTPEEARYAALRRFGNVTLAKEETRAVWIARWIDVLHQDLTYAWRSLRRQPGFTFVAVITLALGIGANAAIFSVIDAVLVRPLKTPDADRLVRLVNRGRGGASSTASIRQLKVWAVQDSVLEEVSAHRLELVNLTGSSPPEQIPAGRVSLNFFRLFHARIARGRPFEPDEDQPNGARVVLLSHEFWTRRFGADDAIVGRTVTLGGMPHLIIGIVAAGFDTEQFDERPDVWLPFQLDLERRDFGDLFLVSGRLKSGVALETADAQLRAAYTQYRRDSPELSAIVPATATFGVERLQAAMTGAFRPILLLLQTAVAFLLLIACVNVGALVLARATNRAHELAIRSAIGAGRWRVVRQLLTESFLLSAIGAVAGLAVAGISIRALLALYPVDTPFFNTSGALALPRISAHGNTVALNWHVIAFTAALSVAATILFGLVPAIRMSRVEVISDLKQRDGRVHHPGAVRRAWSVPIEMALALVLLIGSTLLIRSLVATYRVDPGFDRHHVMTARMSVAGTPLQTRAGITRVTQDGEARLRSLPGVLAAGATCCLPLDTVWQLQFNIAGRPLDRVPWHGFAGWTFVSPGYFDVFKIPLLRGRTFTDQDDGGGPGVVIINETMARLYWKEGDPLHDRLTIGRGMRPEYEEDPVRQIVGIVGDVRDVNLRIPPRPAMYVPMAQVPGSVNIVNLRLLPLAWIVRTRQDPQQLTPAFRHELEEASGGLPVGRIRSMDAVALQSTARQEFVISLLTTFTGIALLLAAVGVYGVTMYSVQRRRHEIGVRLALGATAATIRRMVVAQGLRGVLIGIAVGIIAAFGVGRLLAATLFGVTPHDPTTFLIAPAFLTCVAMLAIWIPSIRAANVDPVTMLRRE
jgi:predicted permease